MHRFSEIKGVRGIAEIEKDTYTGELLNRGTSITGTGNDYVGSGRTINQEELV
jgi:hypothetical protein